MKPVLEQENVDYIYKTILKKWCVIERRDEKIKYHLLITIN